MKKLTRALFVCALVAGMSTLLSSSIFLPATAFADTTTSPPSLTFSFSIPVPDPTGDNPIPVTATFSEPVTGFTASSLNVALGTVTDFMQTSSTTYTFNVVPNAPNGTMSVDSNDPNVKDAAGNIALAAPQLHVHFDNTLPNNTATSTSTTTSSNGSGSSTASSSPIITFLSGPADGSTISTSTVTFIFSVDPASASQSCSFGSVPTIYMCGSPQTFTNLVDGVYPFTVYAKSNNITASSTHTFTINLEVASSTEATTTDSGATSTPSTGTTSATTTPSANTSNGPTSGVAGSSIRTVTFVSAPTSASSTSTSTPAQGTIVPTPIDLTPPPHTEAPASNVDEAFTSNTAAVPTSTDASSTSSTSQAAAARFADASSAVLWGFVVLIILALAGVSWWSFARQQK